jgi:hypothetical protein
MKPPRIIAAIITSVVLTLLAGCAGLDGILGGPSSGTSPSTTQTSELYGTVTNVDTRAQRIDVTLNSNDGRSTQRSTSVYYDSRTQVTYQNQSGRPENLERGDQVDIRVYNNGNGQYMADSVVVTQSVSSGNPNGTYPNDRSTATNVRGTVASVDTRAQRIDVNVNYISGLRNTPSNSAVYYNSQTRVLYQNQTYRPADLERGDQIDAQVFNDNGQYVADTITVTRNVRQ